MTAITIVYYSSTGTVHKLATAVAAGAEEAGAEVRLRRAAELAPDQAIDARPEWRRHLEETKYIPLATHDDLTWADGLVFGTPTRFGNVAAQLKQFMDSTGPLWSAGSLAGKVASGFVSTATKHGGQESTLLALYNTFYHWGAVIVPPGYTDPVIFETTGNPYGTSHVDSQLDQLEKNLLAAQFQGRRTAQFAAAVASASFPKP